MKGEHLPAFVTTGIPPGFVPPRACDGCTLCCTLLPVIETSRGFIKAAREHCEYECEGGCGIYETRPDACKRYACGWLLGIGHSKLHPKVVGFFFELGYTAVHGSCMWISVRQESAAVIGVMGAVLLARSMGMRSAWVSIGGELLSVGPLVTSFPNVAWDDANGLGNWIAQRVAVDTSKELHDAIVAGRGAPDPETVQSGVERLRAIGNDFTKQAEKAIEPDP